METIVDCTGEPCDRTLLVLLPPAFGAPQDFVEHGFVAAVRARGLPVDLIVAGANADHYLDRSVVERLHAEVIAPALARGYKSLWLGGISIGGFGSLLYRSRHDEVEGLLLLAPYLGSRPVVNEVLRAGGLAQWQPDPKAPRDHERELLVWLKGMLARDDVPRRLLIGYGADDRFAPSIELLADALPAAQVVRRSGGHDWETWGGLWREMVARWRPE
jgi:hypothetical protein